MIGFLNTVNGILWGVPVLILILVVGVTISIGCGWPQFRLFPAALKGFFQSFKGNNAEKSVSPYKALCTALAATVGTGNLAGVAGAIAIGGPGAIFWMWVCALLGMATKFAEAALAVRYRERNADGLYVGGPMYMVKNGMPVKWRPLACIYCFFGVVAAFGVGSATQVNAVLGGINSALAAFGYSSSRNVDILLGIVISIVMAFALLGGAKRIGSIAAFLVPFASAFYILLCAGVLIAKADAIPFALSSIINGAFCPQAVTGGMIGTAFQTIRIGAARGVFTNEAGMGTASIAHASAEVSHPVQQGCMGILEVFLDTIVICSMTAFMILVSGIEIPYSYDLGIQITADALTSVYGSWVCVPLASALCCFAVATIMGWGLYGVRCAQYLFGESAFKRFIALHAASILCGAVLSTGVVWTLSEIANGLMAIPNLIILITLNPELIRLTKEYRDIYRKRKFNGGTYENIDQCKPVRTVSYAEVSSSCS